MEKANLIALAKQKAAEHGLEPELVCAVCEQESGWNPWATRYEPNFMTRYIAPLYVKGNMSATEAYTRAMSWGLLQIMGEVAREEGFEGRFLSELCDPATGLEYGLRHLKKMVERHPEDIGAALLAWNGGANAQYPHEVLARLPNYSDIQQAPQVETATSQSPKTIPVSSQG
jgi:soluble lytic murein transglycosylase-like protein